MYVFVLSHNPIICHCEDVFPDVPFAIQVYQRVSWNWSVTRQSYDSVPNCAALGNLVLLQVNFVPSNPSSQVSHMAEN